MIASADGAALRASYQACRRIMARHGRSYFLATALLPAGARPHVHALYGFTRLVDEVVDGASLAGSADTRRRAAELDRWEAALFAPDDAPAAAPHRCPEPGPLPALRDTVRRFHLPRRHFEAFFTAMRSDLSVNSYPTYADLTEYMRGSAAAIGLLMLPILGHPGVPEAEIAPYAVDLGIAFQLTNFIRDVGEDLRRGRLYLPMADLDRFGVERARLRSGVVDRPVQRLLAFETARARERYRAAAPGIDLLSAGARECIRTAATLYGGILDEAERSGFAVLRRRVAVSRRRRWAVAGAAFLRTRSITGRRPVDPARSTSRA